MSVTDRVDLVSLIGFLALLASAAALTPSTPWTLTIAFPFSYRRRKVATLSPFAPTGVSQGTRLLLRRSTCRPKTSITITCAGIAR